MSTDSEPNDSQHGASHDGTQAAVESSSSQKSKGTLRWWPAALLLVLMAAVRGLPSLFESPSLPVMMTGFMGPVAVGILIMGWWCFASRATVGEKILGLLSFVVITGVALALLHVSMQGMGAVVMVIPTGMAAFAIALVLFSKSARFRLPIALLCSIAAFAYWGLQQSEGVTGSFKSQLLWRWEKTAEESYLESLASREGRKPESAPEILSKLAESEWPAFRGDGRQGIVTGVSLKTDWKASLPQEVWRRRIGPGWSSFSVAGDRLFTQEQRGEQEAVVCIHAGDGSILWDVTYPSRFWEAIGGAGPRATPTIDGQDLYALGANGIVLRLDAVDGSEVWRRDLQEDAMATPPQWGFSSSPLVVDGLVIVHAGDSKEVGRVIAYHADDGTIAWSVPSGKHSYSSAQLGVFSSVRGVLMATNLGLQFLNLEDGATIWQYDWEIMNYRVLQPLIIGDSILISASLGEGTRRITVSRGDDGSWNITEDWASLDMKSDFNDFVRHENSIYGFDGSIFACIDADTGERQWKRGRYGNGQVLLLADAGQLLIASEKGELVLVKADPAKFHELAKFQAIDGKTWNHPVVIGDQVYVRNAKEAACYLLPVAGSSKE